MTNNTIKVSPRNRVDFSKIRKALRGMRIPKFLNPYQKLDLTRDEYNTRRNVYAAKEDFFTNGQYDYAKMYEYYKAHPEQFKDLTLITASPTWDNAKRNSTGFADWNSQFNDTGLNYFFGYDANKADYFGPTTSARKGFLEYIKAQEAVLPDINSSENNKRDLPESNQPEEVNQPEKVDEENDNISGDYNPDEYRNFLFKPEPFITPNPFIVGLGLAANEHQYNNEMLKKVSLLEAPNINKIVTNNYAGQLMLNLQMADIRSRAQKQLGSDMTLNLQYLLAVEQGLQPLVNQSAAMRTLEFNTTTKEHQDALNQNKIWNTQYANQNRTNLVANDNNKHDAKSKYQWTRNNLKADSFNKTFTDVQLWSANEKNERDSALDLYNDYIAGLRGQLAIKPYTDLASDPMKSKSFTTVYQNAFNDFNSNRGSDHTWQDANRELVNIFSNDDLDQNAKNEAFMNYLRTSNSDYATQFNQGYNSELTTAKNNAIIAKQKIQNELAALYPSYRNTHIGGWGPWDTRHLGKQLAFDKNGGILRMKHGSRFVDYLEHNRKAIKDQKQTTMEVSKQMERQLKTLLESIDRETLILLRSIFK